MIEHSRLCFDPIQGSIKWPLMFHSWASPRVLSIQVMKMMELTKPTSYPGDGHGNGNEALHIWLPSGWVLKR